MLTHVLLPYTLNPRSLVYPVPTENLPTILPSNGRRLGKGPLKKNLIGKNMGSDLDTRIMQWLRAEDSGFRILGSRI